LPTVDVRIASMAFIDEQITELTDHEQEVCV
jgi:hypothetical protein